MQSADSLKNTHTGKDWRQKKRSAEETRWFATITNSVNKNLTKLRDMVEHKGASGVVVHGVTESDMT